MLRGQGAVHGDDLPGAIAHFRRVLDREPRNIACLAQLASALCCTGNVEKYMDLMKHIDTLEPETPEDFLFLGEAEFMHPKDGLLLLETGLELRDSMLGNVIHAHILTWHSIE